MADNAEYLIFTEPNGKKVLDELKRKYSRKTEPEPIATHTRSAQADVIEYIERNVEVALKRQERPNG